MANSIAIRKFGPDDAEQVSRLIIENLMQVNVHEYDEAAVGELVTLYTPEHVLSYARQGDLHVAAEGPEIIGAGMLDSDHIRCLFVRVDHHKRGIGSRLMRDLEAIAVQRGITSLELQANKGAVDFYRRLGYEHVEEKEIELSDQSIGVVVMRKSLRAVKGR